MRRRAPEILEGRSYRTSNNNYLGKDPSGDILYQTRRAIQKPLKITKYRRTPESTAIGDVNSCERPGRSQDAARTQPGRSQDAAGTQPGNQFLMCLASGFDSDSLRLTGA
eukprot:3741310-Pyramimonas_sp.AAC.1